MLAAHTLDNRSGITNLDFQTYINYGVINYSSDVKSYLKSNDKSGNAFNTIETLARKAPRKLLLYGGLDSFFEFKLALKQIKTYGVKI